MAFKVEEIDVVIYHGGCSDGFGAAWAVYKKFGYEGVEYIEGFHATKEGDNTYWLDQVRDKNVVCYDFSFSRKLTERINAEAKSFLVIDHHVSAQETIGDLPYCYFNMGKSGAVLAWESLFTEEVPNLLKYIQDRDLWKWELDNSREIWSYISSYPRTFEVWDGIQQVLSNIVDTGRAVDLGDSMLRKIENISGEIAKTYQMWEVRGHLIPVANCPNVLRSDVCESLGALGKFPFVGCYDISKGTATWSLRSNHGTEDVSLVAATFEGGGGHKEAAGFTVDIANMDFTSNKVT